MVDMEGIEDPALIIFGIIVVLGLLIPELFHRIRVTPVPLFIVAGIIIGPFGLGLIGDDFEALSLIGQLGLFFLVFLAGLEAHETRMFGISRSILLSIVSGAICFTGGFLLGSLLGFGTITSLLLGTIFMSSSVGEIIPMITAVHSLREKFGSLIIPAIVIMDAVSLISLSIILKLGSQPLEIIVFIVLALAFIALSFYITPKVAKWFFSRHKKRAREAELRFIIACLFVIIIISALIQLHPIVAAFITGLVLGESIPKDETLRKLNAIGYGFLIPIFFITLGLEVDITIVSENFSNILMILAVILTLMLSKIVGGFVYSLVKKIPVSDGFTIGVILWPQLSATLAVAAVGRGEGLIGQELFVAIIAMSIVTAIGTPFAVKLTYSDRKIISRMHDHIVIIGAGNVGEDVIESLIDSDEDFIVIDNDLSRVRELREKWVECIFGDASDMHTLKSAEVDRAKLAIVAMPESKETIITVKNVRALNKDCHIIARAHGEREVEAMEDEVDEFILPEKITSLNVLWYTHKFLKTKENEVEKGEFEEVMGELEGKAGRKYEG